jgi:hypothetical protein
MAVHLYSLTPDDVAADYPSADPQPFSASDDAHGVTVAKVEGWLTRAAANLNSLIRSRKGDSFDVSTDLSEADTETVKGAIIAYAVGMALITQRKTETGNVYMDMYREVREEWRQRATSFETHAGEGRIVTNIKPAKAKKFKWGAGNHEW